MSELDDLKKEVEALKKKQKTDTDKQKTRSLNNKVRVWAVFVLIIMLLYYGFTYVMDTGGLLWFK